MRKWAGTVVVLSASRERGPGAEGGWGGAGVGWRQMGGGLGSVNKTDKID